MLANAAIASALQVVGCCFDYGSATVLAPGLMGKGMGVFRFLLATVAALSLASPACAQSKDAIAEQAAAEFRRQIPNARITIGDPGVIEILTETGTYSASIERVRAECNAAPPTCAERIAALVSQVAALLRDASTPLAPERLMALVRSRAYLDWARRAAGGPPPFVTAPLAGELMAVCYFDLPTARRPLDARDLATMRMNESEALARCKANTLAGLRPLAARWRDLPERGLGILNEAPDEPSYLLFPEQWAPLAGRLGVLIVAAPGDDVLLYGKGSDAIAIDAMATLARNMHAQAQRPISDKVYRWTPNGWQELEWPPAPSSR